MGNYPSTCKSCISVITKKHYQKTRDEKLAYAKEYRTKNKELLKLKNKSWYENNPEWRANWRKNHLEQDNETKRIYQRNKRATDPVFLLKTNLRTRINGIMYAKVKHGKYTDLLGCNFEEYKKYLENKFQDGMSWDNRSKWHIDHIQPCVSFDLTKEEEQKKCFHYTNTQPMWAIDNLKKGVLIG